MKIKKTHFLNYSILVPYMIMSILGLIVVYSTTSATLAQLGGKTFTGVRNQGIFWVVSLILIALIYRFSLKFLRNKVLVYLVVFAEIGLLIATRILGEAVNGAYGWWEIVEGISLQPAEYLKIIIIWYLAYIFANRQEEIALDDYQGLTKKQFIPRSPVDWRYLTLILIGLLVFMPDIGNAVIIALTVLILIVASGVAYRWFGVILGTLVAGAVFILGAIRLIGVDVMANVPVFGYIAKRFAAFFNPFEDLTDSGHQLANSYYAISNGGWFGLGLGNSIEKKGYLPESETDFVFSVVIEEFGLIGASLILAVLFFLILRIFLVGIKAKDPFNSIMAIGIGGMLLVQTFVNIGGVSGLIPSTGVTFPFLSQGGNSLLVISVAIGFVLNIDAVEKRNELHEEIKAHTRHY